MALAAHFRGPRCVPVVSADAQSPLAPAHPDVGCTWARRVNVGEKPDVGRLRWEPKVRFFRRKSQPCRNADLVADRSDADADPHGRRDARAPRRLRRDRRRRARHVVRRSARLECGLRGALRRRLPPRGFVNQPIDVGIRRVGALHRPPPIERRVVAPGSGVGNPQQHLRTRLRRVERHGPLERRNRPRLRPRSISSQPSAA